MNFHLTNLRNTRQTECSQSHICSKFHHLSFSSSLAIKMASCGRIKLFKYIRKIYQVTGVIPSESNRKLLFFFSLAQFSFSTTAYLLFEANSITEYGMGLYTSTTIAIFSFFWQMKNFSQYLENCERFIAAREY